MRTLRPTLLQLILLGFVVVVLPLLGAIVTAIAQVDGFARESQRAVASVQQNAGTSRALADRVLELERAARQYQALGDDAYRTLYTERRAEVHAMIERLLSANERTDLREHLERVRRSEAAANDAFATVYPGSATTALERAFATLREDVVTVVQEHNAIARDLGNALPAEARNLQRLLVGQAAAFVPLSIAFAVLFAVLISRSMRQIDRGIRELGRGALGEAIRVRGARDLEELGERLEWLRTRLLDLEAQKVRFLRSVSHELKTPLTNLREGAELLVEDAGSEDPEEQRKIARILRSNSVRLQQMIETLLRYGADGAPGDEEGHADVRLDRLVADVLAQHRLPLEARSVVVRSTLEPVVVRGNERRLRIIVDNLLSNAVKFTPRGGRIGVELVSRGDSAVLDVSDSGPGIRDTDAAHLFEWFHTGPQPVDALVGGTGIGLAISQEFARQLDGEIELVPSETGARFRLLLPERIDEIA